MSAWWDDPVGWRDAMIPPVTFEQALKTARKAKATRFVWQGVTYTLSESGTTTEAPATELDQWIGKQRARSS
jgi:hypothetical protein